MKSFKVLLLSLFIIITSVGFSQSGYSTNTYYATQGQYTNTYVGTVQQWVCCDAWGNGRYVVCSQYKETLWEKTYGYQQVKVWNYNTGQWYWQWQEGYYWYYVWNYYTVC